MCLHLYLTRTIQTLIIKESFRSNIPKNGINLFCRNFSQKPFTNLSNVIDPTTGQPKKKKTSIIPKITLLDGNAVSITTLDEAQKISKRRDLKLVKIVDVDTKTQRAIYKLMTGSEYHQEDLKQRERRKAERQNNFLKGEKVLMLSSSIAKHDLEIDCKKITKWINKMYEVRVIINGDPEKSVSNSLL